MRTNQWSRYGAVARMFPFTTGKIMFVVATADAAFGDFQHEFPADADGVARVYSTIATAVAAVGKNGLVLVKAKEMAATDTDPTSWAETVSITTPGITLAGIPDNRTQGGLPQVKIGAGSTAMLTIQAPGVTIENLGFNGVSSTGGGILLDDDGGSTKSAFGFTIRNCHFKNCVGSTATNAATGGAIMWAATGGAWQGRIQGCRFYKNVGDIILKGTTGSVPQDIVIEDCIFSGPAASVDCNLYLAGGSGINGLIIRNCVFTAMPAIGSGSVVRFMDLTGCVGIMVDNSFATATTLTFGATGTGAKVPTTVFMPKNYRETTTGVSSEVFRT